MPDCGELNKTLVGHVASYRRLDTALFSFSLTKSSAIADKLHVLVCKIVEVWQDFLSEYVHMLQTQQKFTTGIKLCNLQQLKIAVFTYRHPHFCFPWGRPWSNHAKCCMDGKKIRCLQIVSQNVPIYLQ